ncbi:MAG: nitrogenase component 1 [Methanomicrobiales archaeon]|nr:nitrogenase component 1 [Methanomicrobiales archaeon]MDI6875318.1 nitrogenase component 1 [Methanomicrobiales archaeon]
MPDRPPRPCENPLWPCGMSGAAACLSGFADLGVIVHGSSGCYFYTASLLEPPIYGTCILESEIIFGSRDRLQEVVDELRARYARVAIVNTCVPAVIGEDLRGMLDRPGLLIIDSPGFSGDLESGYRRALGALSPVNDGEREGVNIDGLNPADPFYRGNALEALRLLNLAGVPPATCIARDRLDSLAHCAPVTLTTNEDLQSGVGDRAGSLLGLEAVEEAFAELASRFEDMDLDAISLEALRAKERIQHACDKHLRRFDPPVAVVCGNASYASFAAGMLEEFLDAQIACIAVRNDPVPSAHPCEKVTSLRRMEEILTDHAPDLILGSSYEHSLYPTAAFCGLIPPIRNRYLLHARPLIGIEGAMVCMEDVLNACRNQRQGIRRT